MRWVFRGVGAVLVMILIAIGGVFLLPAERIAQFATRQFEAATGREMRIEGTVKPTIWPVIGVQVQDVSIANAPGSQAGPMLQAESVDIGVDLSALISGSIDVRRFEAVGAEIVLERDSDGRGNWELDLGSATSQADTSASGSVQEFVLERGLISGATVRFLDAQAGTDVLFENVDGVISLPEARGRARVEMDLTSHGERLAVEAELGSLAEFLEGAVVSASVQVEGAAVQGAFEGRLGLDPVAAEGQLNVQASALGPIMAFAGAGGSEVLPEAARPLSFRGAVTLAPAGSLHLRETHIGVGENTLEAALDISFDGPRPRATGEIRAQSLDLRPFITSDDGASTDAGGSGWSQDTIDASALGSLDAEIGITTGPVETGSARFEAVRGVLIIDRARAVFTMSDVRGFDGVITGEVVANNRSGLSVGGNVQMREISLQPFMSQMAGVERLAGAANMNLRFLGVGQSVDAIMRSLEGQGDLSFGQGEILGLDLAGMLRNLDASYVGEGNRTIYDSITGAFQIENGVLRTDDFSLASSLVSVATSGAIGLGEQVLDLHVTPEAVRDAESEDSLRVPLLVTGPWSSPRFRLDLEGLAEARLAEERERLEARAREEAERLEAEARQRVRDEISERLGVEAEEGQSTEEVLRDGVEEAVGDAVERGLLRLLGAD